MSALLGCSSSKAELYDKVFKTVGEDETKFAAIKRYEKLYFPIAYFLLGLLSFFRYLLLGLVYFQMRLPHQRARRWIR